MTCAAILQRSGFVPDVPALSQSAATPENKAQSHVPVVPVVPPRKGEGSPDASAIRAHLLALGNIQGIDAAHVLQLGGKDVAACTDVHDAILRAYLRALHDPDLREHGKRPADETAQALCRSCGPVWIAPHVANVAPMVDGWPRVLGCVWCHVKNRRAIPRPPVACGQCRHFARDTVNPSGGVGRCQAGHEPLRNESLPYPNATRACNQHEPARTMIDDVIDSGLAPE